MVGADAELEVRDCHMLQVTIHNVTYVTTYVLVVRDRVKLLPLTHVVQTDAS
jgi:hypothetical protein